MADRTLCDAQLRRGACELAMAGDSVERDEGCEGWQAAWHLDLLKPACCPAIHAAWRPK